MYICVLMSTVQATESQLKAIQHIYGPIRVLAGPGTGKTEILSLRIANLLTSEAQVDPTNILCMTFTDAARLNMRQRLAKKVGPATAKKIAIHTYHSFCNEVIQQNLKFFNKEDLDQVTELESIKYVQKILDNLPKGHILRDLKRPYKIVNNLIKLFETIKSENLNIPELHEKIELFRQTDVVDNPAMYYQKNMGPGREKGTKKADFDDALEKLDKVGAAIDLFPDYKNILRQHSRYDFNDMIHWVIDLFKQQPDVLASFAERYQYIMVDEYQDTNGSQNALIAALADADMSEAPNLFVVGDDDQSIFRFQGANSANMRLVEKRYPSLKDVQLVDNFRSTQIILDFAENFIKSNVTRIKKNFTGLTSHSKKEQFAPTVVGVQNARHENIFLAKRIKTLVDKGVPAHEIAVLMPKNKQLSTLSKYLQHYGIATYIKKQQNLLEMPLVQQILQVLSYINKEVQLSYSGDDTLFKLLHLPFFGIKPQTIARAIHQCNEVRGSKFREFLLSLAHNDAALLFGEHVDPKLSSAILTLESLIEYGCNYNVYQVFKNVVHHCKIREYVLLHEEKIDLLDQLTTCFDFIEEETDRDPDLRIEAFMEQLQLMEDNKITLNRQRAFGNENGVQLLTVHSSKGLEFEHVFIAACTEKEWEKKTSGKESLKLPKNILADIELAKQGNDAKDDDWHELRRLMYVGITRAKQHLTFSYHRADTNGKEIAVSSLLLEAFADLENISVPDKADQVTETDLLFFEPIDREITASEYELRTAEEAVINKHIDNLKLSVTALNNYLKCPVNYYYNNVLKVPSGTNEHMSFGSAVHNSFEDFFTAMLNDEHKAWPSEEFLVERFKANIYAMRRNFTPQGMKQKEEYGIDVIRANYKKFINEWTKETEVEWKPPHATFYKEIPISGFADRIDYQGKHGHIIDYKTGDFAGDYAKKQLTPPKTNKQGEISIGGDYWRQAVFYKLLIDNATGIDWKANSAEFIFVEPLKRDGSINSKKFVVTPEDEIIVGKQIEDTYAKINNKEFSQGCGDEYCDWCNFLLTHQARI
jgi:DNA helicase II / ATP-dependent DNA helicase PcrA